MRIPKSDDKSLHMKYHRFPWRKQCLVGLSSLYLGSQLASAHASTSADRIFWEARQEPVFSQTVLTSDSLLLSQRAERRGDSKLRDKQRRRPDHIKSGDLFKKGAGTLKQAAKMAQLQHGGKVLKVERQQQSYRVKMLRDGRVSYVKIPAH